MQYGSNDFPQSAASTASAQATYASRINQLKVWNKKYIYNNKFITHINANTTYKYNNIINIMLYIARCDYCWLFVHYIVAASDQGVGW